LAVLGEVVSLPHPARSAANTPRTAIVIAR
jgi:hypothetical protein